jgi:sigma-B regulation protein RsbU (phosphoserine phosphatase)
MTRPLLTSAHVRGARACSQKDISWTNASGADSCRPLDNRNLSLPGFGLLGYCRSAGAVGGDFYDVLPTSGQSVLLVVADVMGKGAPAAQFAALLRTELRILAFQTLRPARLLGMLNRMLFEDLSRADVFITAQLALVEARERRLSVASAGHCPLLLANGAGEVGAFSPDGMPLGILPEQEFAVHVASLDPSCRALLYTDGLTEARNSDGEFFGEQRLRNWLGQSVRHGRSVEELSRDFLAEVRGFQSRELPKDDQTFLLLAEQTDCGSLMPEIVVPGLALSSRIPCGAGHAQGQVAVNE